MNRIIILLLVLFTFSQSHLFGQKILWGDMQHEPVNGMLRKLITLTDNGIYSIKGSGSGPYPEFSYIKHEKFLENLILHLKLSLNANCLLHILRAKK